VRNGLFAYQQRTLPPDDIELVGPPSDRAASRLAGAISD
jgi:hypothetical protein